MLVEISPQHAAVPAIPLFGQLEKAFRNVGHGDGRRCEDDFPAAFLDFQAEVRVFGQFRVPSPAALQGLAAEGTEGAAGLHVHADDIEPPLPQGDGLKILQRLHAGPEAGGGVARLEVAGHGPHGRVVKRPDHVGQGIAVKGGVGIHRQDETARRELQRHVGTHRPARTPGGRGVAKQLDQPPIGIGFGLGVHVVGGTVVHHDDLHGRVVELQQGLDGLFDAAGFVVSHQQHADEGMLAHEPLLVLQIVLQQTENSARQQHKGRQNVARKFTEHEKRKEKQEPLHGGAVGEMDDENRVQFFVNKDDLVEQIQQRGRSLSNSITTVESRRWPACFSARRPRAGRYGRPRGRGFFQRTICRPGCRPHRAKRLLR